MKRYPLESARGDWLCASFQDAPYGEIWELQTALVAAAAESAREGDVALIVEHQPVFTLGRRGGMGNLKVSSAFLDRMGVSLFHVERGGDITYHGPGQLVLYPIVNLPGARLKVVDYVEALEEVMIRTAEDFGVKAQRSTQNRGVWVGTKKLGSVGIAVRRGISFHGLALNVNVDLTPFSWIHPCGLQGVQMTSLALEGAKNADMPGAVSSLKGHLEGVFGVTLRTVGKGYFKGLVNKEDDRSKTDRQKT